MDVEYDLDGRLALAVPRGYNRYDSSKSRE